MEKMITRLTTLFALLVCIGGQAQRVSDGLQSLYTFREGAGQFVQDVGLSASPLTLKIQNPGAVQWIAGGGLRIAQPTLIKSLSGTSAITAACAASNEITLEAWIKPLNTTQDGPARIITSSFGTSNRNFILGQTTNRYMARVRTTTTDAAGTSNLLSSAGAAQTALQHVVYTRNAAGQEFLYVNGVQVAQGNRTGSLSAFLGNFELAIGNEIGSARPWQGDIFLAAVYSRALNANEVVQNKNCGELQPGVSFSSTTCANPTCFVDGFGATQRGLWLPNISFPGGTDYRGNDGDLHFEKFEDGTAHLYGQQWNLNAPTYGWNVDVWFSNKMNWSQWSALGRGWKGEASIVGNLFQTWEYYIIDTTRVSSLTGLGAFAGSTLTLTHKPTNFYYGLQVGVAANDKNNLPGYSVWMYVNGTINGHPHSGEGDFNLEGECVERPVLECLPDVTVNCVQGFGPSVTGTPRVNCAGEYTLDFSDNVIESGCPKIIQRLWTATSANNTAECLQTITVYDQTAPTISAAGPDATIQCPAVPEFTAPTATDACGEAEIVIVNDVITNGVCEGAYTRKITWKAVDACGNASNTVSQTIHVIDTQAPSIEGVQPVTAACNAESINWGDVTAVDNCGDVTLTHRDSIVYERVACTHPCHGNTRNGSNNNGGSDDDDSDGDNDDDDSDNDDDDSDGDDDDDSDGDNDDDDSDNDDDDSDGDDDDDSDGDNDDDDSDNDDDDSDGDNDDDDSDNDDDDSDGDNDDDDSDNDDDDSDGDNDDDDSDNDDDNDNHQCPDSLNLCSYKVIRTWTAVDACGNVATARQIATVSDVNVPVFVEVPQDIVLNCTDSVPASSAVATDDCGTVTVSQTDSISGEGCNRVVRRTFTAVDNCGNQAQHTQVISISDNVDPVFDPISVSIQVPCSEIENLPLPTATDNCGTPRVTFEDVLSSGGCLGTLIRTYTATDACGNTATTQQFINILDNQGPVITAADTIVYECGQTVETPEATANDNCSGVASFNTEVVLIDGECLNTYTKIYIYTAIDSCDNVSVDSTVVIVRDITAPTLENRPESVTILCNQEVPAVVYPIANDACDAEVTVQLFPSEIAGECENERTIVRRFVATDDCGNSIEYVQTINVVDTLAPVFADQPSVFTYTCGEAVPFNEPAVSENCGQASLSHVDGPVQEDECLGFFERTWTAVDACGNEATFVQIINKIDTVRPVITGAPAVERPCTDFQGIYATANDNCTENLTITFNDMEVSGGCAGRLIRTYRVEDACGNVAELVQVITLIDTNGPTPSFQPVNKVVECGTAWSFDAPTFSDECDLALDYSYDVDTIADGCNVIYRATWTATDNCENTTVVRQQVNVRDTQGPEFTVVPADYNVSCEAEIVRASATAVDVCDGPVEVFTTEERIDGACANTYTIRRIFRAFDGCGNSNMRVQEINVFDTTAPSFDAESAPAQLFFECPAVPAGVAPTATDNCSEFRIDVAQEVYGTEGCITTGAFIYTATDSCGNVSEAFVQNYTIRDTQGPEVTSFEAQISRPCTNFEGNFIEATDACNDVVITHTDRLLSGGCAGVIERTYLVKDNCGNVAQGAYVQYITLVDNEAPTVVEAPADITLECGSYTVLPTTNVSFIDNCDPDGVAVAYDSTVVENNCSTFITRRWIGTDNCGNADTVYQVISILDTQAPYFTNVPAEITVACDQAIEYTNATAFDLCTGALQVSVAVDTLAGNCLGNYTIVRAFTAADACGRNITAEQRIHVVDEAAPIFSFVPAGGLVNCSEFEPETATAQDNCGTSVVVPTITIQNFQGEVDGVEYCGKKYIYEWTATDDCTNARSATTTYIVYDNEAPSFVGTLPTEPIEVQCANDVPAFIELSAEDNCSTANVIRSTEILESDSCGNQTIKVNYVALDACGNSNSAFYTIIVNDTTDPEFDQQLNDIVLSCDQEIPAPATLTATDNCSNAVVTMNEVVTGPSLIEGAVSECRLITPDIDQATGCKSFYNNTSWAMWLGANPTEHKYFRVVSGNLYTMNDGSLRLIAQLENAQHPEFGGFSVNVKFNNPLNWTQWSTQAFPTSFKADCGGVDANFASWTYYLLQNEPGAELTGYGMYAGSALSLGHAPSSKYFGFQKGDGANNLTQGEGLGGWFEYTGNILFDGSSLLTANARGGDFAFNLNCCPRTVIHRCYTATDCSGNTSEICQTIRYEGAGDSNVTMAEQNEVVKGVNASAPLGVSVFPNPTNDLTTFVFQAAENAKATIEIFDVAGALVTQLATGDVVAGNEYRMQVNVNSFAEGIYMYRIVNGGSTEIGRVIVIE